MHIIRGVSWGGGLWGPRPPGVTKGAPKRRKGKGKKERKRKKKEEKKGKKERKKWGQESKKDRKKVNQHDERGAMQYLSTSEEMISGAPI